MPTYKFKIRFKNSTMNWDDLPIVAELIVYDNCLVRFDQVAQTLAANPLVNADEVQVTQKGESPRYFINMEK